MALAIERGYRVLASRPAEFEATLSYAGLGDLLEPVLDSVLERMPGPQRDALEVALLRRGPGGSAPDQRTVAAGTLSALRALAEEGPVLVGVDDLQWLDRPSARVLAFSLRRVNTEPVAFLATVRTALTGEAGPDLVLPVRSDVAWIEVGPLSLGAMGRMLRSRLDETFSRPIQLKLHRASGGNPFFALELARALLDRAEPPVPGQPLPIPNDLTTVIRGRLTRLSSLNTVDGVSGNDTANGDIGTDTCSVDPRDIVVSCA